MLDWSPPVGVAQLVELLVVVQAVVGSSPIAHPHLRTGPTSTRRDQSPRERRQDKSRSARSRARRLLRRRPAAHAGSSRSTCSTGCPRPSGLVRAGVAPDHPKIKSVTRIYEKTAPSRGFRFFGNVELGSDVTRDELLEPTTRSLYAVGAATDRRLGIPGEDLPGSHPATEFVAWYNGHPDYPTTSSTCRPERAVVIGNGNVALDVARMLVPRRRGARADRHRRSRPRGARTARCQEVVVLGRRGPAQAAFTNPELRELGELAGRGRGRRPGRARARRASRACGGRGRRDPAQRRDAARLRRAGAGRTPPSCSASCARPWRSSATTRAGCGPSGSCATLELTPTGAAAPTGERELARCGLVLRAVGYRGEPIPGVPFDAHRGLIPNDDGRVTDGGEPEPGVYVAGWIKRGPAGVIGTNKKYAAGHRRPIVEDARGGRLPEPSRPDAEALAGVARGARPEVVDWAGWQAIDAHERALGEPAAGRAASSCGRRSSAASPTAADRRRGPGVRDEPRWVRGHPARPTSATPAASSRSRFARSPERARTASPREGHPDRDAPPRRVPEPLLGPRPHRRRAHRPRRDVLRRRGGRGLRARDASRPTCSARTRCTSSAHARALYGYVGYRCSGAEMRGNSAIDIALWDLLRQGRRPARLPAARRARAASASAPTTPAPATATSARARGRTVGNWGLPERRGERGPVRGPRRLPPPRRRAGR